MPRRLKQYGQKHRHAFGELAEVHVRDYLSAHGETKHLRRLHYDLLFERLIHIEVKATQLCIIRTGYNVRRVNHGWTLYEYNHRLLCEEPHGFYALALMIDKDIIHFRFLPAKQASVNLTNSPDSTYKPRIRFGALYKSMTPEAFIATALKIKEKADGTESPPPSQV